jgi:hypothetical protein
MRQFPIFTESASEEMYVNVNKSKAWNYTSGERITNIDVDEYGVNINVGANSRNIVGVKNFLDDGDPNTSGRLIWNVNKANNTPDADGDTGWDKDSFLGVKSWAGITIRNNRAFESAVNLKGFEAKNAPIVDTETTKNWFAGCELFDDPLKGWKWNKVKKSVGMFDGCISLSEKNFRTILQKMNLDKNPEITWGDQGPENLVNITPGNDDNVQYIGAADVVVRERATIDLIDHMYQQGQVVVDFDNQWSGLFATYKNYETYNTSDLFYNGAQVSVVRNLIKRKSVV